MVTVDIQELEKRLPEVMSMVKDGETVEVLEDGKAVARLTPVERRYSQEEAQAFIDEMDRLAAEISKYVTVPVDAVQIVREIRRDL